MSKTITRTLSQLVFIASFFFLLFRGNLQLWVGFWVVGILISLFFDRIYCGWACPMGTLLRMQSWIYEKLNISRYKINSKKLLFILRTILILAFLGSMIAVARFGLRLNIIIILVGSAFLISFIFAESIWHRICPHGTVLSFSNKFSRYGMKISADKCSGCGLCEESCPNDTIFKLEDEKTRKIENKECLTCFQCQKVCPADAISYQKI
ncbi:MAG: 4Fe-4S binding protein [Bacillota bacterium]